MPLDGHVISTGSDGVLVGMTPDDVTAVMNRALQSDRLVMHFHGGLVDEARGMKIAEGLLPMYAGAGAYPVCFVWRAGALEILRNNILEIAREELFDRLIRRVLGWAVGKVRGEEEGGRGGPMQRPSQQELDEQLGARKRLTDPDAGSEPFADEQTTPQPLELEPVGGEGEPRELTPAEEQQFLAEVRTDAQLQQVVAGVVAHRDVEWTDLEGARGVPEAEPVPSMIDDAVLAQIAEGTDDEGARGLLSMTVLAKKALQVLRGVLLRYRNQTDSGVYPTVVEEVLRAFYLANVGGALWNAMKNETLDTFAAGHADRAGGLVLDQLTAAHAQRATVRTTLVGHSTGAVFIDNLLAALARSHQKQTRLSAASAQFQVCYLAPACTTQHFAQTLDVAGHLIGRFRMFTMTDDAERADRLVGAVYPRSLLYLVSGLLERDREASAVAPVLGLSRYLAAQGLERLLASELATTARLDAVRKYSGETGRVVLSPTALDALEGARSSATSHGAFDDDELVRGSLAQLIRSW
jgi:hypothetical protein